MPTRSAGEGRYARVEREQRWLLASPPDGLTRPLSIVDLYVDGTRLRVRRMESEDEVVYKLAQKVRARPEHPETVKLTNIYLSAGEYDILASLDGHVLRKTRWRWDSPRQPVGAALAVDEFLGPLAGLVLAEVELPSDAARLPGPPGAVAEVTDDDRFSGGCLARTTADTLATWLAEHGVDLAGRSGPGDFGAIRR